MKIAGIVAEYNPFHTGHAHQIRCTRARMGEECAVVAVMSGNWVQQADCAIADKWTRARLALMGGADLVLELPTVWAVSTAESFARGAVDILNACGVVDVLSFGSECGDVQALQKVAECLDSEAYERLLPQFLQQGLTFAVCRQRGVEALLGTQYAQLLAKPNNNLGVEYIRALNALKSGIEPMTVLRQGAQHNSVSGVIVRQADGTDQTGPAHMDMPQFVSATQIRLDLSEGRWEQARHYLPEGGETLLKENTVSLPSLEQVGRAMLSRVRTMTAEDWSALPDSGVAEGLPQRLERAGRSCTDMNEFFSLAKTKRYTHARLSRLVLWAYLGLTAADVPVRPPYIRVLGFNDRGREVLRQMKERAALPMLTKPAHSRQLNGEARALFELEARCTDLYDLCFAHVQTPGREWLNGPVVLTGGER